MVQTWRSLFLSKKYKVIKEYDVVILAETYIGYNIPVLLNISLIFLYVEMFYQMEDIMVV